MWLFMLLMLGTWVKHSSISVNWFVVFFFPMNHCASNNFREKESFLWCQLEYHICLSHSMIFFCPCEWRLLVVRFALFMAGFLFVVRGSVYAVFTVKHACSMSNCSIFCFTVFEKVVKNIPVTSYNSPKEAIVVFHLGPCKQQNCHTFSWYTKQEKHLKLSPFIFHHDYFLRFISSSCRGDLSASFCSFSIL